MNNSDGKSDGPDEFYSLVQFPGMEQSHPAIRFTTFVHGRIFWPVLLLRVAIGMDPVIPVEIQCCGTERDPQ